MKVAGVLFTHRGAAWIVNVPCNACGSAFVKDMQTGNMRCSKSGCPGLVDWAHWLKEDR